MFAAEPAVSFTIPGLAAADDDVVDDGLDADDEATAGLDEASEDPDPEAGREATLGLETVLGFDLLPP